MDDGSEDVNDFLRRVAEMDDRHNREDEERTRMLEEQILKGRRERQERRAERARSISPVKDSPSNTPPQLRPTNHRRSTPELSALRSSEHRRQSPRPPASAADRTDGARPSEQPPASSARPTPSHSPRVPQTSFELAQRSGPSRPSPSAAVASSRGSPLSWQRRPDPLPSGARDSRPGHTMSRLSPASPSPPPTTAAPVDEGQKSKADIARSLQSKDPSFFRQTEDRGARSPAYRRVDADVPGEPRTSWTRSRLPGMSSGLGSAGQSDAESPPGSAGSTALASTSRSSLPRGCVEPASSQSTNASLSGARGIGGTSLPDLSTYRFDQPKTSAGFLDQGAQIQTVGRRGLAMSPSQGRISPDRFERPSSPTKGLGGFVQSAVLKRSDSFQKRWSAQPGSMHSRENSLASRSGLDDPGALTGSSGSFGLSGRERRSRTSSTDVATPPDAQPRSQDGGDQARRDGNDAKAAQGRDLAEDESQNDGVRFSRPHLETPPASPSKLSEQKRWSPSKSSWLESALNKAPESRKIKSPVPEQPSWMTSAAKSRQQEAKVSAGKDRAFREIKTTGLMRPPPLGAPLKPGNLRSSPKAESTPVEPGRHSPDIEQIQARPLEDSKSSTASEGPTPAPKPSRLASVGSEGTPRPDTSQEARDEPEPKSHTPTPPGSTTSKPWRGIESRRSPGLDKAKPPTPPKKDFRSVLKPRQAPENTQSKEEPEFKNVFGRLRHTKTERYVAPDELKSNILRGKAGLAVSAGPKRTERRDELKESLLRQKDAIKSKSAAEKQTHPDADATAPKPTDADVPEAIAKRRQLSKSADSSGTTAEAKSREAEAVAKPKASTVAATSDGAAGQPKPTGTMQRGDASDPSTGPSRFNDRLAGLLSKGPPPPTNKNKSGLAAARASEDDSRGGIRTSSQRSAAPGTLTHITKGRAKGPRRRPPPSTAAEGGPLPFPSTVPATDNATGKQSTAPDASTIVAEAPSRLNRTPTEPDPDPSLDDTRSRADGRGSAENNSVEASVRSCKPELACHELLPARRGFLADKDDAESKGTLRVDAGGGGATPRGDKSMASTTPSSIRIPARSSSKPPEERNTIPVTSDRKPLQGSSSPALLGARPLPSPPKKASRLEFRGKDELVAAGRAAEGGKLTGTPNNGLGTTVKPSPSAAPFGVEAFFSEFFGGVKVRPAPPELDLDRLLSSRGDDGAGIKTVRKQIWRIGGDGKQEPLPSHQEHILFEDNMYMCIHHFRTPVGKVETEAFLWAGDNVSEAAVEDAQLFARKAARANNARLIRLRQGLETPSFFQALGGIVVVRRGAGSHADSSVPYMLCGRRHLGHIAFDEVEFSAESLCSGFPYIVSAPPGRTYIWKGKGGAADELGCARLIGMDSGMAGAELEEVDEGTESSRFIELLGGRTATDHSASAGHWLHKPDRDDYEIRLFRIDHELETRVVEISPFCQTDLHPSRIFCLDAFFEMYIIVGSRAHARFTDLCAAISFAREFGELAHSKQGRPSVPTTSVIFGTPPAGARAVFRKWRHEKVASSPVPLRGRGLDSTATKAIPLDEAVKAISELTS